MSYDEGLAERLREQMAAVPEVAEKKMFGGLCFMVSGNMCCGIVGDSLMARVGPDQYDACLRHSARAGNGLHRHAIEGHGLCRSRGHRRG